MKPFSILYGQALTIALNTHRDQKDKGGRPYISHPLRVCAKCQRPDAKLVALLHDVLEDGTRPQDIVLSELKDYGFPESVLSALLAITKKSEESYHAYIRRVGENPLAVIVKIHDLEDNLNLSRLPSVSEADLPRINKYIDAYRYLTRIAETD